MSALTLADFIAWERPRKLFWRAERTLDMFCLEPGDDLDFAKRLLSRNLARERRKGEVKHWSFDSNVVVACRRLLVAIAQFEAEREFIREEAA